MLQTSLKLEKSQLKADFFLYSYFENNVVNNIVQYCYNIILDQNTIYFDSYRYY